MADLTPDQKFQEANRIRELRNQCLNVANGRAAPGATADDIITEAEKLFAFVNGDSGK